MNMTNYSIQEVRALNNLLDYLLEHDYRRTREYLEETRAEGEFVEQKILEEMSRAQH